MRTRRFTAYVAVALCTYAAALIATLPATWIAHVVEVTSDHHLVMRETAGGAWAGSGRVYARRRSGELVDLGSLQWKAFASSLLAGSLRAELTVSGAAKPIRLELSPTSITLQSLDLTFPGMALASFAPALETLDPEGTLHVRSDSMRFDRISVLGLADVEWRAIRLAGMHDLELGSHLARLRGGGKKVDIELLSLDGPLELSGKGTWTPDAGLRISGSAEPHTPKLATFLKSMCADYRDSRCAFRYAE